MCIILMLWFLSIRTYLYMTIRDIQYSCEGYMALALVVQETFSSLLVVTLNGVRMACHFGCSASPWPSVYRLRLLCHREGGFYICLPSESNGPNLLDELLSGFIWFSGVWA
jgi:hypothetical protein